MPAGPVRSTAIRPRLAASSSRAIVRPSPSPVGRPVDRVRRPGDVGAVEAFEDVVDVGRRDPRPGVADADPDGRSRPAPQPPSRRRRRGCGRWRWPRRCGARGRGDRDPPRRRSRRDRRPRSWPRVPAAARRARGRSPGSQPPRSTRSGRAWSGAASALARSSMSATTPPSAAAAERAASSPAGSVGTTPSIIAWSCDSSTVAGVARSWAMSLAARRRSISDRSSRSAMALNASASSADSRSSPPVARALDSPASSRRAAAATSCSGRVRRPAIDVETTHDGEHADEPGHRERHVEQRQEAAVAGPRRERRPGASRRPGRRPRSGPRSAPGRRRAPPERGQRRPVRADDLDLATELGREPA